MNSQKASVVSMREEMNTRQEERAERIVHMLGEFDPMSFQEQSKSSKFSELDDKMSTTTANDSGVGDEIETWRLRAENAVRIFF